jgi:hypothetical protein
MLYNPEEVVRIAIIYGAIMRNREALSHELPPEAEEREERLREIRADGTLGLIHQYREEVPFEIKQDLERMNNSFAEGINLLEKQCKKILQDK